MSGDAVPGDNEDNASGEKSMVGVPLFVESIHTGAGTIVGC